MSSPPMLLAQVDQSPLKVRRTDRKLVGTYKDGATVFIGTPAEMGDADLVTFETASGQWRIRPRVEGVNDIVDRSGSSVAQVRARCVAR